MFEDWISDELEGIRSQSLERTLRVFPQAGSQVVLDGTTFLNFSSNDYLNLASDPRVIERATVALREFGASASASRLMTGSLPVHQSFEIELASFVGKECALLFGSGYLANLGAITSLVSRNDFVLLDRLVHASLLDGALLSRAHLSRYRHNDLTHLSQLLQDIRSSRISPSARILVVTESVFSMDGDCAPVNDLVLVCQQYGAMVLVDDAHAFGVFGGGLVADQGLSGQVNVVTVTLGKALGGAGGAVICSQEVQQLLINRARPFIFNTALPPAVVVGASAALEIVRREPELGKELLRKASLLKRELLMAGLKIGETTTQIIPIIVGTNERALAVARALFEQGIIAVAIRPPTVPDGSARIRLSVTLAHSDQELLRAAKIITQVCLKLRAK